MTNPSTGRRFTRTINRGSGRTGKITNAEFVAHGASKQLGWRPLKEKIGRCRPMGSMNGFTRRLTIRYFCRQHPALSARAPGLAGRCSMFAGSPPPTPASLQRRSSRRALWLPVSLRGDRSRRCRTRRDPADLAGALTGSGRYPELPFHRSGFQGQNTARRRHWPGRKSRRQ